MRIESKLYLRSLAAVAGLAIAVIPCLSISGQTDAQPNSSSTTQRPASAVLTKVAEAQAYGRLPMSFEANRGQTDRRVKFVARGAGYSLYLNGEEAVLALRAREGEAANVVRMQLQGRRKEAEGTGIDVLPGTANYFVGNRTSSWRTAIPTYAKVQFASVYPGIDLVYYGNQGQLEYDFVVMPHADARLIQLHFAGARGLTINAAGDLLIATPDGEIAFHRPVVYQKTEGKRTEVGGRFVLSEGSDVSFATGEYDHTRPLVIDPQLVYSTFVGGDSGQGIEAIAVDPAGNAYVTGTTVVSNYPVTSGALQATDPDVNGQPTVFVAKINASGTALVYSTYLGGSGQPFNGPFGTEILFVSCGNDPNGFGYHNSCGDYAGGIAVDSAGNAYLTGNTFSTDFPVTAGAFQPTNHAATSNPNAFVTKLNPTGTALVYSTYLGGSGGALGAGDWGTSIAVDRAGEAYVGGYAFSWDFPVTAGAFQTVNDGFPADETAPFVSKLNATGTALVYSTFIGGGGYEPPFNRFTQGIPTEGVNGLAIDPEGNAYVTGVVYSFGSFPVTPGAFQTTFNVECFDEDCGSPGAFVSKLNSTGTALVYSTFLVGTNNGSSIGNAIAVDKAGSAYVAGNAGGDFPVTPGAFETSGGGPFLTKLNPDGSQLVYSTFFKAGASGIAVDAAGDAFIAGGTGPGLPTTPGAFQTTLNGSTNAFLTEFDPTGSSLVYSTYLGGSKGAIAAGLALGSDGAVYLAGSAGSDFPVTPGALQTTGNGGGFVTKLMPTKPEHSFATTTRLMAKLNPQNLGMSNTFTATVAAVDSGAVPTGRVNFSVDGAVVAGIELDGSGIASYTTSTLTAGSHTIEADYEGTAIFTLSSGSLGISVLLPAVPVILPAPGKYVGSVTLEMTDATHAALIHYTTDGSNPNAGSMAYTGPITLSGGYTVVKAIAIAPGYSPTPIIQAAYSLIPQAPQPVIGLPSGRYPSGQKITITDADPKATIRYTTDGTTPTPHSFFYDGPIVLQRAEIIKTIAIATGEAASKVAFASYTAFVQTPAPTISPASGTYGVGQQITLADSIPTATIRYTTDGSAPTTTSAWYHGPIQLSGTEVIRAIAISTGAAASEVSSASYTTP